MKKIIFVFALLVCLFGFDQNVAFAKNEKTCFAKVENAGVNFYSSPNSENALFEIEQSYFVNISLNADDFYKASYNGLEGYVKKSDVVLMNGQPQNPYVQATFNLFASFSIYTQPSKTSTALCELDDSIKLTYFGKKVGQQINGSNVWYYCSAQITNQTYRGYVFSGVAENLSAIVKNNESFDVISESDLLENTSTNFAELSTNTKIMLIVSISVPSLIILYFLVRPTKIMQNTKKRQKAKKETRKIRHGDYFEFDESEL